MNTNKKMHVPFFNNTSHLLHEWKKKTNLGFCKRNHQITDNEQLDNIDK